MLNAKYKNPNVPKTAMEPIRAARNSRYVSILNPAEGLKLRTNIKDTLSTRSTDDDIKSRVKIKVKADNLNSILDKVRAPKIIDFFSLDVEGDEFDVLEGINFKKYKFKFILIETYHLNDIKLFFRKHGYKYQKKMSNRNDHLFKLKFN